MGIYINPVISGFNPDPSICMKDGVYYLATSSFEYFPGCPIYKSKDMVNWTLICNSLYTDESLDLNECGPMSGVYAPTLRYYNGTFYMITTNSCGPGHLYVTTTDIESGIWSDPIFIKGRGFDPDLFFDDDGKVYFTRQDFGGEGIWSWEIDITTGELFGEGKLLWNGHADKNCEAPHIYKINNMYYLMLAEGGTFRGHMITIARSNTVFGEYIDCPHNPILTHRTNVLHSIQSCGHGDLIQIENGSWWIVFLATRPVGNFHHLGRETYLAPVSWDEYGWPHVNNDEVVNEIMNCEGVGTRVNDNFDIVNLFEDKLSVHLNFKRNPRPDTYKLIDRKFYLKFDQNPLGSKLHRSFVGVKQKHFDFSASIILEIPSFDQNRAGLCLTMSDFQHYCLSLSSENGQFFVTLYKHIYDIETITNKIPVDSNNIKLIVTGNKENYLFYYENQENNRHYLGSALTCLMSAEVGSTFTGTYVGLYAAGNDNDYAIFDKFEYHGRHEPII